MYAIVDIAGKQFKVAKDQYIYAPKLEGEAGAAVNFDSVLLVDNDGKVDVGAPTVKGVKVSGTILEHVKGNKVIVFKRKGEKVMSRKQDIASSIQRCKLRASGKIKPMLMHGTINH